MLWPGDAGVRDQTRRVEEKHKHARLWPTKEGPRNHEQVSSNGAGEARTTRAGRGGSVRQHLHSTLTLGSNQSSPGYGVLEDSVDK